MVIDMPGQMRDALELEEVRFAQYLTDSHVDAAEQLRVLRNSVANRGLTGHAQLAEAKIPLQGMYSVALRAIELRQQTGRAVPHLLDGNHLQRLSAKLTSAIDNMLKNAGDRPSVLGPPVTGAAAHAISEDLGRTAANYKIAIEKELRAIELSARIGMPLNDKQTTTIHITDSVVANLQVGDVIGDINASIQTLQDPSLQDSTRWLAEAIASNEDLQADQKKELLEHLAMVTGEVAAAPTKRKIGPLKTSMAFLQSKLSTVTDLAKLYAGMEKAIDAATDIFKTIS